MQNRWNDTLAAQCADELALRAYTSRLLGGDPALVLHGGGNTSIKIDGTLWVKGSGSDLARVEPKDFTPLSLRPVQALLQGPDLSNEQMMQALAPCITQADRPRPSIETLLHATLPFRFVEHTHADAILAVTNTVRGEEIARNIFGDLAPLVPFHQSGFELAKASFEVFVREHTKNTIGLILLRHGVFAFGNTAREAYSNMLRLVNIAEDYLVQHNAWALPRASGRASWKATEIAMLRRAVCHEAGFPLLGTVRDDEETRAFAQRTDLDRLLTEGPATPQHAVFIKRLPLVGRDVAAYAQAYRDYVAGADQAPDPAPRVVLDPAFGALVLGFGTEYLQIADDIFEHGREIMTRASGHDRYHGLPAPAILEAEIHYGGFERRILAAGAISDRLRGLCIGLALDAAQPSLRDALRDNGAAVVDVTDDTTPESIARRFGGLDGILCSVATQTRAQALLPVLALSPVGGKYITTDGSRPPAAPGVTVMAGVQHIHEIIDSLANHDH